MRQEDYNSMMKFPWETKSKQEEIKMPKCPKCNYEYLGDGIDLCTECQSEK
tara:strand:- start:426 stop:578 length:153 start_codon:yes stop_codon:yes gene_type:complete